MDESAICVRCDQQVWRVEDDLWYHHMTEGNVPFRCINNQEYCCVRPKDTRPPEDEDLPLDTS